MTSSRLRLSSSSKIRDFNSLTTIGTAISGTCGKKDATAVPDKALPIADLPMLLVICSATGTMNAPCPAVFIIPERGFSSLTAYRLYSSASSRILCNSLATLLILSFQPSCCEGTAGIFFEPSIGSGISAVESICKADTCSEKLSAALFKLSEISCRTICICFCTSCKKAS